MSLSLGDPDSLWTFIDENMETYNFRGHDQVFLPKRALDEAAQRNVIESIILQETNLSLDSSKIASFVDQIHGEARRLFLICMFCALDMGVPQKPSR